MEVETPTLCQYGVTDPHTESIPVTEGNTALWLRTSPEYHMKRLLAAGSGDIYQIGKVFRSAEAGRRHQPEFSMLEWYRLNFSMAELIAETCALIITLGELCGQSIQGYQRVKYRQLFLDTCDVDPLTASAEALKEAALASHCIPHDPKLAANIGADRNAWLDLLASHRVYPSLNGNTLWVVEDYPAEQAMLARLKPGNHELAERFEIFLAGVELANGYHELEGAREQEKRFAADRAARKLNGAPDMLPDPQLIAALDAGLPDCCGVAVGLDRLILAAGGHRDIALTMSFVPGN